MPCVLTWVPTSCHGLKCANKVGITKWLHCMTRASKVVAKQTWHDKIVARWARASKVVAWMSVGCTQSARNRIIILMNMVMTNPIVLWWRCAVQPQTVMALACLALWPWPCFAWAMWPFLGSIPRVDSRFTSHLGNPFAVTLMWQPT